MNGLSTGYLSEPAQWLALAEHLRAAGQFGLDTEYYGLDSAQQSCVGRARVHVWSVATRTDRLDPRGYHRCDSWVLPVAALDCAELRVVLEDPTVRKEVHNQPVDHHALRNHGVNLRGARNTLDLVRWCRPELVNTPGRFKLKALMETLLRREPVCEFDDVVSDTRQVSVTRPKNVTVKGCVCGVKGCRKRKPTEVHQRFKRTEVVGVTEEKTEHFKHPLETIVPGHARWDLLVRYAAEDAVAALQVAEICDDTKDPAPWPYNDLSRPKFSQPVVEAVIAMEAEGFPVDVAWCRDTLAVAEADEDRELQWLHRWFVVNAPTEGPWCRRAPGNKKNGVDDIWASPAKKVRLFDVLGFPRSPIWGKGRVKRGEAKVDQAAMAWIASNYPPSAKLMEHLTRLQRIRSGKKYLAKMRDSGGWIHPICGPAGDDDDRAGAVTGRLGIKGQLESQQLPSKEDRDLYLIRKGICAEVNV